MQVLAQQDVDEFELDVIGALLRPSIATVLFPVLHLHDSSKDIAWDVTCCSQLNRSAHTILLDDIPGLARPVGPLLM